jgi:predicted small lipoprotein YifL
MKNWTKWLTLTLSLALTGCGGTGTLVLTTWGEEYIEQEIPPTEFEDGFTVQFSKFLVVLKDFTLATKTGRKGPTQSTPLVVDVHLPGPLVLQTFEGLEALKYDQVSYGIGPASNAVGAGNVAAADVQAMTAGGHSLWVEGTVAKGGVSKRFAWKFDIDTRYTECTSPDFGEGATVPVGGEAKVELTIHGDHLWYDDLQSPDAKLRGTAIFGADADQDGTITQQELTAVSLTTLPLGQYGTGGASSVKSLNDFVRALGRTVGHFRGEGECVTAAR